MAIGGNPIGGAPIGGRDQEGGAPASDPFVQGSQPFSRIAGYISKATPSAFNLLLATSAITPFIHPSAKPNPPWSGVPTQRNSVLYEFGTPPIANVPSAFIAPPKTPLRGEPPPNLVSGAMPVVASNLPFVASKPPPPAYPPLQPLPGLLLEMPPGRSNVIPFPVRPAPITPPPIQNLLVTTLEPIPGKAMPAFVPPPALPFNVVPFINLNTSTLDIVRPPGGTSKRDKRLAQILERKTREYYKRVADEKRRQQQEDHDRALAARDLDQDGFRLTPDEQDMLMALLLAS